jgi:molybdate transport system substrate-binding protein
MVGRALRLISFALAALCMEAPATRAEDQTLVFAAASLTDALDEVAADYTAGGKTAPKISYAASSALARQIEHGAPASLFISADEQWMDYLAARKLIVADTRRSFLGNRLVLVMSAKRPFQTEIEVGFPLAEILGGEKLAMADPDSVPAGRYGKAALVNLGVWDQVQSNVIRADHVRAALTFVERDEARAGIVYETDAMTVKTLAVAGVFPETSRPPISYSAAIVADHDTPDARAFYTFLLSAQAGDVFRSYGFIVK